jgi:Uma2 family endonuclease
MARVTLEDFERFLRQPENQERRFELINGEIMERKEMTEERGVILGNIAGHLHQFVTPRQLGRLAISVDYSVPGDDYNFRTIDISFSMSREPIVKIGTVKRMPDLAVEFKTRDMKLSVVREKAMFYLAHGSRMAWLVFPERRHMEFYHQEIAIVLNENDILDGGDVLPGFTLAARDIFKDPAKKSV